jgi:acyl-coenzyme A synthetase/AMP-(fatty) acid ligase
MPGVRDCAAMAVNLEGGTVTVGVVLVLEDGASREEAMAHMQRAMSLGVATGARVLFLDALPRGAAGKLDRLALQRLLHAPRES